MKYCTHSTLDFCIHFTSSYYFLGGFVLLAKATTPELNFSQYFLEASFIEYPKFKYTQSNLAANGLYFALKDLK